VFVGSYDNHVYSLDLASGELVWKRATGNWVQASPAFDAANDLIVVGSWDKSLYAFDAASGAPRWRRAFADPIWSSAAIAGGGLAWVGTQGRFLEAVDAASGAPAFSVQLGGGAETEAAPAVVGACVVAATWGGVVALVC